MNDGQNNKKIKPEYLDEYLSAGFSIGKIISENFLKANSSAEHNKRVSESMMGHSVSEEIRTKISNSLKGRKVPESVRL